MKKILFVHTALVCGGVEKALLDLCKLFCMHQYDVTVLECNIWCERVLKSQFIEAGIRVIDPFYKISPPKNAFHKLYGALIAHRIDKEYDNQKIVLNERFDIVVYYQITGFEVSCRSTPKIISYVHGDISSNEKYRNTILKNIEKLLRSDSIICVSNRVRDSLQKYLDINNNIEMVYNPIDSDEIVNKSKLSVTDLPKRKYICSVGRFSGEKRFDLLIRIHKTILDMGVEHDLLLVGDGIQRHILEEVIRETQTEASVHLVGYKDNPYPYMVNSLFTVCSSCTEGLPVTSMESLCLGIPIVSSFPSVKELFGNEMCGIITGLDEASLTDGIYKMLTDKNLYQKCLESAQKKRCDFCSEKMFQKVEQVYR